jgi:N-acetyl-anhydromuramyl-L-alanine amidase AmpD
MPDSNSSDGWCPFATRVGTTKFWTGNQGRRAVVMHIAQGSYDAAVTWLSDAQMNPNSSAHFVLAKDGRIAQLVSVNDSAWANGLGWQNNQWVNPSGHPVTPSWQDIVPGVNPNWYTISVEHEGVFTDQWTSEMYAANNRLLQWLATQFGSIDASPLFPFVPHRNLIGHYEIDPVDRPNCPGPNVNYSKITADADAGVLLGQVKPQAQTVHIYGTTALVSLPFYGIVKQLTETDIPVAGYLDYQNRHWAISQYSYQNQISNFFDNAATVPPVQDLEASLSLNPGYRDAVTPSTGELRSLGPQWLRVLLFSQYQDLQTGQNSELDWLIDRCQGIGINLLVLVNPETLNEVPPPHGSGWGDANSGYVGRVSDLAQKVAAFYHDKIGAVEVFNEPDVQAILPEDYGALLAASYAKIKAVSSLPVISAGICCGENLDYLRRMAQVARGSFDGVGWHVYAERVDGYPSSAFGFGELRDSSSSARALGGKPLWVTEIGAQLDWNWGPGVASPDAVAAYLTRAYNLMRTLGRNIVAQAFWFTWRIAGESWGLVDDSGARRPAWYAFQQSAGQPVTPVGPPATANVTLTPPVLEAGQLLNVSVTVINNSGAPLATQGPDPGFVYNEGDTFQSRGFPEVANAIRIGVDFDGRTGIDHPYRWGLGAPLAPGASATVTGSIRLNNAQSRNFWVGLVQEQVAWLQDRQGVQTITVSLKPPPPIGTQPTITNVNFTPATLNVGQLLNVSITVRNDSSAPLPTQGPNPGFVYAEGETFTGKGFAEQNGAVRVGIDFDGRSGIDHPYRWGLGMPLGPGQSAVVNGSIRLLNPQSRNYWSGLVQEQVMWLQDNQGTQAINVNPGSQPPPPPVTGQPLITSVTFSPTTLNQGQLVQVSVTVKNNSNSSLPTQGPDPGFVYNEGDNFLTKNNPPANGAYRIGVDFDGRSGVDHPYRWGLGNSLAPGQSVIVGGFIRLNRRQHTNFWVGLIQEGAGTLQDQQGTTALEVVHS